MRTFIFIFFLSVSMSFLLPACAPKPGETAETEKSPTAEEINAADEASLLATAKAAGVSDDEALAAKAEIDMVYDEASAKMGEAEAERIARMRQLKDKACIENCPDN